VTSRTRHPCQGDVDYRGCWVVGWTLKPTVPFRNRLWEEADFGQSPVITVIGKAMWDVGHAPKEQNNRHKYMPDYAVWEIHPVMKLEVIQ
jgi:hypothetical protein